jgi:hypothetical protein
MVLPSSNFVAPPVKMGLMFGNMLAIVVSYTAWHSIGFSILHGLFGWGYILYYAIRYSI